MHFVSLFSLNESPIYGPWNVLFPCFLSISYLCLFQRGFFQIRYLKSYHLLIQISEIYFEDVLQNIRMSKLVILKWRPFEYKPKFDEKASFI